MSMPSIRTGAWSKEGTMPDIPEDESWAVTEFAVAELDYVRRTQRLVELATVLVQRPSASLADVYDRLVQERPSGVNLLVREAWNRRADHPERYLWAKVAAQPVVATLTVRVPRRGLQPPRQATVSVRWCLVLVCPPRHRRAEKRPTVAVWAV
jgi:hypothetical protein